jgi:hypothetical protein
VDILFLSGGPFAIERLPGALTNGKHFCRTAGLLITTSMFPTLWAAPPATTTPIKYVVVIFQENNSFDHYFGTYPNALYPTGLPVSAQNPSGESPFVPLPNTPSINGLTLLLNNLRCAESAESRV